MKASLLLSLLAASTISVSAAPIIELTLQADCNIFAAGTAVQVPASLRGFPPGSVELSCQLTNYFGEKKSVSVPVTITAGKPTAASLALGVLEPGYYDLLVTGGGGKAEPMSLGVAPFTQRTSAEARAQGSRFGLKTFSVGQEGIWWRRPLVWNLAQVVDTTAKLGLQWTRHQFNQPPATAPGAIGTDDLITKHAMNVVLKIEGFPEDCYDATRYGPLEEWKAKNKNKNWNRNTVPIKAPYQAWLKGEIAKIPPEQNIFEIGNEVWGYMSAEEFAEWCAMTAEAVRAVRPQAKIGADPGGGGDFQRRFLAAGGMKGLQIWYSHPYSFTPLPEHRTRAATRNIRDLLRIATGQDFELYITEYGWPTAPKDKLGHSVSEKLQAQRTVRQSLMLYAEDAKALIPHWMGDREQDITEREHFFGFYRLNQSPKPVVMAFANCARMIDGSRFVGDLDVGEGIGAMLFQRGEKYTLALWTAEDQRTAKVDVGVPEVTAFDMMGREKKLQSAKGQLTVALAGDMVYLVGVSPALAQKVIKPDQDLNPDTFSPRTGNLTLPRAKAAPKIDGSLDDWTGAPLAVLKDNTGAARGEARMSYDANSLYLAVKVAPGFADKESRFDLLLGTRPSRQPDLKESRPYDFTVTIAAQPGGGTASIKVSNQSGLDMPSPLDLQWKFVAGADGAWTAEAAIPTKVLLGFPKNPAPGTKLSGRFVLMKGTPPKPNVVAVYGAEKARLWPYLIMAE